MSQRNINYSRTPVRFQLPGTYISSGGSGKGSGVPSNDQHQMDQRPGGNDHYIQILEYKKEQSKTCKEL